MARRDSSDVWGGTTLQPESAAGALADISAPVLTVLYHPDTRRIGQRSRLNDPGGDGKVRVSRTKPLFGPPRGIDEEPLAEPHLSRQPLWLEPLAGGAVRVIPTERGSELTVDGEPCGEPREFSPETLADGVVLELAQCVVLLLHTVPAFEEPCDELGLVGKSRVLNEVRLGISRVAAHDVPVLLRGESGTGKELVAQAIHAASRRATGPFVGVNMAALVSGTAAAALFGHTKGAFTGAAAASDGFFGKADTGTLFLDEIGDTPSDVQAALLRALESGEVQQLGSEEVLHRDVRIIAATDANLEAAVEEGRFRLPLLQRLSGYELCLPPLRQRREDLGRLLVHFLREYLAPAGRLERLEPPAEGNRPWLPARLVTRAALAHWPGNVRQLRHVAQRLAIDWADAPRVVVGPAIDQLLGGAERPPSPLADTSLTGHHAAANAAATATGDKPQPRRLLSDIREEDVLDALRRHAYRPGPAAAELGVSRSSLYALIEASPHIRKAGDLDAAEIRRQLEACGGEVPRAAQALEVSERALRIRMKQLGLR